MESGVRMLLNDMKRALDRGVKIRILTGNYLGITQPSALYLIKSELGDRVDLRLYNETSRSFHPKSYIFHYESSNEIYIGSSNISKSALTSGIEWNYRFSDTLDKKNYELFYATFEDLFLNHSIIIDDEELKRYSKAWKKPAVSKDLAKYDATEDGEDRNAENVRMLYRPRGAQIEALYALQESRMEGAAKGLVYAATGIGKTYLAAFDSAKYKRVLFVAHREDHPYLSVLQFADGFVTLLGICSIFTAVYCCRCNSSLAEFFCHVFCMLSGTAESDCTQRTIFSIIFVNQIISSLISDISLIQLLLIITPLHDPQSGIIRLIIHAVIVKWYKHSFVDRFF